MKLTIGRFRTGDPFPPGGEYLVLKSPDNQQVVQGCMQPITRLGIGIQEIKTAREYRLQFLYTINVSKFQSGEKRGRTAYAANAVSDRTAQGRLHHLSTFRIIKLAHDGNCQEPESTPYRRHSLFFD